MCILQTKYRCVLNKNLFPNIQFSEKWQPAKEKKLSQRGVVFWFTGLSGAGKSTLAEYAADELLQRGYFVELLDGDNIRSGLCKDLGFSLDDRKENIRRVAELAKLLKSNGIIVITAFISPTQAIRAMAKEIVGARDFKEVYINTSIESCEKRDVKGLYARARKGVIENFTGVQSPYEAPGNPDIEIKNDKDGVAKTRTLLLSAILKEL